jgi:hypothetical protein
LGSPLGKRGRHTADQEVLLTRQAFEPNDPLGSIAGGITPELGD